MFTKNAGNENDRSQVHQFIGLLRRMAVAADAALVLTSHPSLSGMASGTGMSGSTAWNASVRSRLYLHRPKSDAGEDADPDERVLEVMKSNYGPAGEVIRTRWQRGVFIPTEQLHWIEKKAANENTEDLFLRLLKRFEDQGRNLSDKPTSTNYAPTVFACEEDAKARHIKKAAFVSAMSRLFAARKIHVVQYGRPPDPLNDWHRRRHHDHRAACVQHSVLHTYCFVQHVWPTFP